MTPIQFHSPIVSYLVSIFSIIGIVLTIKALFEMIFTREDSEDDGYS